MRATDTASLSGRTARPLDVTRLGFGGAPLGNLYRKISEEDAQATLRAAHACGVRLFDTAPYYGLGRSEERFGTAIESFGRETIVLSTKIGRLLVDGPVDETTKGLFVDAPEKQVVFDYSYDGVMRSHDASLERLGVAAIDILLIHDVDVWTHGSQAAADEKVRELFDRGGYRALEELKAAGRIAAFGAGVNEWQACEALLGHADFDCFLLAGRYTLIEQEALTSFLPTCVARDVGIILGGPYNSGILATGAVEGARFNYQPAPPDIMERVRRIESACRDHGVTLPAAALQFVLAHPAVKSVIPGAMAEREVRQNVALLEESIPASTLGRSEVRASVASRRRPCRPPDAPAHPAGARRESASTPARRRPTAGTRASRITPRAAAASSPHFSPSSWSARRCPADRVGTVRSASCASARVPRDAGHRASAVTHAVGRRAPPVGSRPGARPRRRGPQPYAPIRFSTRSWRIERLGATQAVTLVRSAG